MTSCEPNQHPLQNKTNFFSTLVKNLTRFHGINMDKRETIISTLKAMRMMRKEYPDYLVYLHGELGIEKSIRDMTII